MSEVAKHLPLPSYVAIGWRLVTSKWWKTGVRFIRGFLLSLGLMVCYSVFGILSQKPSLCSSTDQWGRLQPRFPVELLRRPLCKELKLVWFGDFKIQFWVLCSDILGACLVLLVQLLPRFHIIWDCEVIVKVLTSRNLQ
jgi:hypothetical protein